jgi:SRSO17 transposase
MPRIGKFPFFGKRFFRQARKSVGSCHFGHFWRLVVIIAAMHGRRSLSRIRDAIEEDESRTRQAISHFLTRAEWDAPELLRQAALDKLRELGWKTGETLHAIIDDTQKRKRGKRMDAVCRLFLHAEKVYAKGHTIVACALVYRGVVIPYAVRLWANKAYCKGPQDLAPGEEPVKFRKLTELAGDMVGALSLPSPGKVVVLFDSFYLCPAVINACEARGFCYAGVVKKNRNFFPDGRPRDKRKLGRYGANVLQRDGRNVTVGGKKHRLAERVGRLSKAGRVKLVFSRRPRETAWIAIATNALRWGAKTVLSHYLIRWGIEVLFKMSKQYLGLGDYQVLRYRAVERYLHLVLIAHLLLTHLALREPDVQAAIEDHQSPLRLPSIPQLQQTLRDMLLQDVLQRLEKHPNQRGIARKIKEIFNMSA